MSHPVLDHYFNCTRLSPTLAQYICSREGPSHAQIERNARVARACQWVWSALAITAAAYLCYQAALTQHTFVPLALMQNPYTIAAAITISLTLAHQVYLLKTPLPIESLLGLRDAIAILPSHEQTATIAALHGRLQMEELSPQHITAILSQDANALRTFAEEMLDTSNLPGLNLALRCGADLPRFNEEEIAREVLDLLFPIALEAQNIHYLQTLMSKGASLPSFDHSLSFDIQSMLLGAAIGREDENYTLSALQYKVSLPRNYALSEEAKVFLTPLVTRALPPANISRLDNAFYCPLQGRVEGNIACPAWKKELTFEKLMNVFETPSTQRYIEFLAYKERFEERVKESERTLEAYQHALLDNEKESALASALSKREYSYIKPRVRIHQRRMESLMQNPLFVTETGYSYEAVNLREHYAQYGLDVPSFPRDFQLLEIIEKYKERIPPETKASDLEDSVHMEGFQNPHTYPCGHSFNQDDCESSQNCLTCRGEGEATPNRTINRVVELIIGA